MGLLCPQCSTFRPGLRGVILMPDKTLFTDVLSGFFVFTFSTMCSSPLSKLCGKIGATKRISTAEKRGMRDLYESRCQTEKEKKESLYSIGCRIRHFRRKAKMTQSQLASLVDIDGRTLSFYENGSREMGVNRLFQIAAVLHVSADDLAPEWIGGKDKQDDEMSTDLSGMFAGMSAEQKVQVLEFARFIIREKAV